MGSCRRSLGHWRHAPSGDCGTLYPSSFLLLIPGDEINGFGPSCILYHTGPKQQSLDHGLEPPNLGAQKSLISLQVNYLRYFDLVTVN